MYKPCIVTAADLFAGCMVTIHNNYYRVEFGAPRELYFLPIFLVNDPIKYGKEEESTKEKAEIITVPLS